jgi:hypothetical protein
MPGAHPGRSHSYATWRALLAASHDDALGIAVQLQEILQNQPYGTVLTALTMLLGSGLRLVTEADGREALGCAVADILQHYGADEKRGCYAEDIRH